MWSEIRTHKEIVDAGRGGARGNTCLRRPVLCPSHVLLPVHVVKQAKQGERKPRLLGRIQGFFELAHEIVENPGPPLECQFATRRHPKVVNARATETTDAYEDLLGREGGTGRRLSGAVRFAGATVSLILGQTGGVRHASDTDMHT